MRSSATPLRCDRRFGPWSALQAVPVGVFQRVALPIIEREPAITHRDLVPANKAGVNLSVHKLRKGFGCRAAQQLANGDAPIPHTPMRHSSMQITLNYYASVDDTLQATIDGLT